MKGLMVDTLGMISRSKVVIRYVNLSDHCDYNKLDALGIIARVLSAIVDFGK